jgi:hypothetical protein
VNGDGITCGAAVPCQSVYQFSTTFTAGTTGTKARVGSGNGGTAAVMYNGTFDDAYYTSATPTGALYVCGALPNDPTTAVLWKIPINNNVMGSPVQGPSISATGFTGNCSPVSEIKNGTHDYIYVGIPDHATDGTANVCGNGAASDSCLYMFDLSDLNGPVDSNETWIGTFTGGGAQNGDTITINGTVITGTSTNNSASPPYTFRSQGNGTTDGDELAGVAGALSGITNITVSSNGAGAVTFTYATVGDVADNLIVENLTGFTITSHTDGISGTGSAWATSSVPSAGMITLGSVGGVVMDNISTTVGTSQLYFSNTGTDCDTSATTTLCGNAYQASQSGLQ